MAKEHPYGEHGLEVPPTHTPGGRLPIPGGGASRVAARTPAVRGVTSRVINVMQRNLVHLATPVEQGGLATPEDIEAGEHWYPSAQQHAQRLGRIMGADQRAGAALISSLSPQTDWEQNLIKAHDIAVHGRPTYEGAGWSPKREGDRWLDQRQNKAEDIINMSRQGHDVTHLFTPGLKTHSFLENIDNPQDQRYVTIDTHAHNAAVASRTPSDNTGLGTIGRYNLFAHAYHGAARHMGMTPSTSQARIWTTWKRMNPLASNWNFDQYLRDTGHYDRYYSS